MMISQLNMMTAQISQIFKDKGIDINGDKNFNYDIFIKSEIPETEGHIISIEVKSADDVLSFLNFLHIQHVETAKTLNDKFHIEKGYFISDEVYLVIAV